jgi:hypothetical protein
MRHFPGELDFTPEPLVHPLVRCDFLTDGLERDPLVQLEILGLVQLAHAAARDEPQDAEAIAKQIARLASKSWSSVDACRLGRRGSGCRVLHQALSFYCGRRQ